MTKLEKITYKKVIATILCNLDHHFLNELFHNKKKKKFSHFPPEMKSTFLS